MEHKTFNVHLSFYIGIIGRIRKRMCRNKIHQVGPVDGISFQHSCTGSFKDIYPDFYRQLNNEKYNRCDHGHVLSIPVIPSILRQ